MLPLQSTEQSHNSLVKVLQPPSRASALPQTLLINKQVELLLQSEPINDQFMVLVLRPNEMTATQRDTDRQGLKEQFVTFRRVYEQLIKTRLCDRFCCQDSTAVSHRSRCKHRQMMYSR